MKPLSIGMCTLAILLLAPALRPVQAQKTPADSAVRTFRYDVADEVTITGTVSSVLAVAAPGMMAGSHLLLVTSSGPVDASLGRFGLSAVGSSANDRLTALAGQHVEATGVIRMHKDKPVLLVRTVNADGEVYTLRNEHGVALSPQARKRTAPQTDREGESR
jgi:hypothetical protein